MDYIDDLEDAIDFIVIQLEGPGKRHGYWWMKQVHCTHFLLRGERLVGHASSLYTYLVRTNKPQHANDLMKLKP